MIGRGIRAAWKWLDRNAGPIARGIEKAGNTVARVSRGAVKVGHAAGEIGGKLNEWGRGRRDAGGAESRGQEPTSGSLDRNFRLLRSRFDSVSFGQYRPCSAWIRLILANSLGFQSKIRNRGESGIGRREFRSIRSDRPRIHAQFAALVRPSGPAKLNSAQLWSICPNSGRSRVVKACNVTP